MRRLCAALLPLLVVSWIFACSPQSGTEAAPSAGFVPPEAELDRLWREWSDAERQQVPAIRIFDDLSYIGLEWVSCYVLETSVGLVLIDSLYGDYVEHAVAGIRSLGLDPAAIHTVLVTHAHFDHAGGARSLQERYGARIAMTAADWDLAAQPTADPRFDFAAPEPDLVLGDGDVLTLGQTEVRVFETPGHTEGVLSMTFPVRDGEDTHQALVFGGVGLNFSGVERLEAYLDGVARLRARAATAPVLAVNLSNHPGGGRIFERGRALAARAPGAPHPFVDPEALRAWLDERRAKASERLAAERKASQGLAGEGKAAGR